MSQLVGDCCSLSHQLCFGAVNDQGADKDASVGRRLNDVREDSLSQEIGLSRLLSLSRSIGLGVSSGENVDLGAGLSGSESMLLGESLVDDFGRYPDTCCRYNISRGHNLSLCDEVRLDLEFSLGCRHCEKYGLRHCLSDSKLLNFCDSRRLAISVSFVIVDDNSFITALCPALGVPRHGGAAAIQTLRVPIPAAHAFITSRKERRVELLLLVHHGRYGIRRGRCEL